MYADLVTFTEEIRNGKLFFCAVNKGHFRLEVKKDNVWNFDNGMLSIYSI